mmetsp:Transcript_20561/g.47136  ORF Transcript_20561/g.47136 Transcript_20561/m.47136 type:complete len:258 (-) Transcript_20561:576-1349(-)
MSSPSPRFWSSSISSCCISKASLSNSLSSPMSCKSCCSKRSSSTAPESLKGLLGSFNASFIAFGSVVSGEGAIFADCCFFWWRRQQKKPAKKNKGTQQQTTQMPTPANKNNMPSVSPSLSEESSGTSVAGTVTFNSELLTASPGMILPVSSAAMQRMRYCSPISNEVSTIWCVPASTGPTEPLNPVTPSSFPRRARNTRSSDVVAGVCADGVPAGTAMHQMYPGSDKPITSMVISPPVMVMSMSFQVGGIVSTRNSI